MKKRVRFGLKMNLPFGLFANAGTFVVYLTGAEAERLYEYLYAIQALLIGAKYPQLAGRIFIETGET